MELKGSKTEANLLAAFAGESQARTKYTYYASRAKKDGYEQIAAIFEETANNDRRSTPSCGLSCCMTAGFRQQRKTCWTRQTAKTMSGPKCTRSLPMLPTRRASTTLPPPCVWWPALRNPMRSATASCAAEPEGGCPSLSAARKPFGFAVTAAISTLAKTRRRSAPRASTRRHTLSAAVKIIEPFAHCSGSNHI